MFLIIKDICAVIGAFCILSFLFILVFVLIAYMRDKSGPERMSDQRD
jgi:hypothetical protein